MTQKPLLCSLFAAAIFIPASAAAQDMPVPCGEVTYAGACEGDSAVFCSDEDPNAEGAELITLDCNDFFQGADMMAVSGECVDYPGVGAYCAAIEDTGCLYNDGQGGLAPFACAVDGSGTIATDYACVDGTCQSGNTACTPPAEDAPAPDPVCENELLILGCFDWGQKYAYDCTGENVGGTGCSANTCVGIPAGGLCDDEVFLCADGLTCSAQGECTDGTQDPAQGDGDGDGDTGDGDGDGDTTGGDGDGDTTGGDGDGDAAGDGDGDAAGDGDGDDDAPEEPAGGLCSSTGASTTSLFGVLALGLLAIRRRRG